MRVNIRAACIGVALALAVGVRPVGAQEGEPIKPVKSWTGRIAVEQAKLAPKDGYIITQKALDTLWKDWAIKGDAPKVDFDKNIVLTAMTMSSGMGINPSLDKKTGNLEITVIATADITRDYGFHVVLIPRAGIKTINGMALGKAKEKR